MEYLKQCNIDNCDAAVAWYDRGCAIKLPSTNAVISTIPNNSDVSCQKAHNNHKNQSLMKKCSNYVAKKIFTVKLCGGLGYT